MKNDSCSPASGASCLLRYFIGGYLLIFGLMFLIDYMGTMDMLMTQAEGAEWGVLAPVASIVAMLVAYSWPVVKPLLGLSYLANFQKCWASKILVAYLFLFFLAHMAMMNMTAATFDLVFVALVMMQKMCCGMASKK